LGCMAKAMRSYMAGEADAYQHAGSIADEAFSLIRTVTSLGIQGDRISKYDEQVQQAAALSISSGLIVSIFAALFFGLFYAIFSMSFWLGAVFLTEDRTAAANAYPLNMTAAPTFCRINGTVSQQCSTQIVSPSLVWNTMVSIY